MTIEEAKQFLSKQNFTFARSYADTFPHYYLQKKKCSNIELYEKFLWLIREQGIVYHFFNKQYIYLFIDDYVYWEMGRPIPCVQVINKAHKNSLNTPHQSIADSNISKELKDKLYQREMYLKQLLEKKHKNNNDYQQINFLLNTERRIHGGGKNIIDNFKQNIRYE